VKNPWQLSEGDIKKQVELCFAYAGKYRNHYGFTRASYGGLYGWVESTSLLTQEFNNKNYYLAIMCTDKLGRVSITPNSTISLSLCPYNDDGDIENGRYCNDLIVVDIYDPEGIKKLEKMLESLQDSEYLMKRIKSLKANW
jgi:hypothetical protein